MHLPTIHGREFIPVRYISYVTGWDVSPDVIAQILAHSETFEHFGELYAYHIQTGSPAKMLPKEWDVIEADLEILEAALRKEEKFKQQNYPEWRKQSIPILPAGVFVWKDEFEQAYTYARNPERLSSQEEIDKIRALNLTPFLPPDMKKVVFEGFESILADSVVGAVISYPAPYLLKDHPYFSAELEAAVSVWMALYESGEYKSKQAHKKQIKDWLQLYRKAPAFSTEALERITTLVNPQKKGGPPRIENQAKFGENEGGLKKPTAKK